MKQFIYNLLFLLSLNATFSQSKELILRESYEVDENTTLEIDIDNVSIVFEESKDNKVHLDYTIQFSKDSEDIMYRVYEGINAKAFKKNNSIKIDVKNSMLLGELYSLDVNIETYKEHIRGIFKRRKENKYFYKSKDSIFEEIKFSIGSDTNDYFKKLKLENPNKDYGRLGRRFKQHFIIKVPRNLKIKIKALHSTFNFTFDVESNLDVSAFKTYFKFKNLRNKKHKFKLTKGIFQAEKILGGNYNFKDILKVRIGSIEKVILKSENSKIQVGQVKENVAITDYDSKIDLFNFSNRFKGFNFKGEYSKLGLYKVKNQTYAMNVLGYNTVLNLDDNKTTFGDSKEKKLTKILEKKPKKNSLNKINIELKNGILNIK